MGVFPYYQVTHALHPVQRDQTFAILKLLFGILTLSCLLRNKDSGRLLSGWRDQGKRTHGRGQQCGGFRAEEGIRGIDGN